MPEVGGPLDPDNEAHDLVMSVFGEMSKGERNRIKVRVRESHPQGQTNLSRADLEGADLRGANLQYVRRRSSTVLACMELT